MIAHLVRVPGPRDPSDPAAPGSPTSAFTQSEQSAQSASFASLGAEPTGGAPAPVLTLQPVLADGEHGDALRLPLAPAPAGGTGASGDSESSAPRVLSGTAPTRLALPSDALIRLRLSGVALGRGDAVSVLHRGRVIASAAVVALGGLSPEEGLTLLFGTKSLSHDPPFVEEIGLVTLEVRLMKRFRGFRALEGAEGEEEGEAFDASASGDPAGADPEDGAFEDYLSGRRPGSAIEILVAPPFELLIPEGPASRNLAAMADFVCREHDAFLSETGSSGSGVVRAAASERESVLEQRVSALEERVRKMARAFALMRLRPASRLSEDVELLPARALGRARRMDAATLRDAMTVMAVMRPAGAPSGPLGDSSSAGLHGAVRARVLSTRHDTEENRMFAGFVLAMERRAGEAQGKLIELMERLQGVDDRRNASGAPHGPAPASRYVSSGGAVLSAAVARIGDAVSRIAAARETLRGLCREACRTFGIDPRETAAAPFVFRATPVMLASGPFRAILETMLEWRENAPDPGELVLEERFLLEGMERSRLYEYFVLLKLLRGLADAGLRFVSSRRAEWKGAGALYEPADHPSVFVFERPEAQGEAVTRVTLWYQPVISGRGTAGEEGVMLRRATRYSLASLDAINLAVSRGALPGLDPKLPAKPFYTPDYVICVERGASCVRANGFSATEKAQKEPSEGVRRRWIIVDAKYSKVKTVLLSQTPSLIYKYLFSVRPLTPQDAVEGLWVLCGNALNEPAGAVTPLDCAFDAADAAEVENADDAEAGGPQGFDGGPAMVVERLDAEAEAESLKRRLLALLR